MGTFEDAMAEKNHEEGLWVNVLRIIEDLRDDPEKAATEIINVAKVSTFLAKHFGAVEVHCSKERPHMNHLHYLGRTWWQEQDSED